MKTGVIDTGGGQRGIYAAGVFDRCIDENVRFDLCIGISAGSANVASFMAGQRGRNYRFYTEYSFRRQYMGFGLFLRTKSFFDMDYVYGTLSNSTGEDPLRYQALADNPAELLVISTNAQTGMPVYFTKRDVGQDNYDIMKASSALPFMCRPYRIGDTEYYDGALGDPVPVRKALDEGCDKVVLILTRPEDVPRTPQRDEKYAARIQKQYPKAAEALRHRAEKYNFGVALAREYVKTGKVLIISPDDTCGVGIATRKKDALDHLYRKGLKDGERIGKFLSGA